MFEEGIMKIPGFENTTEMGPRSGLLGLFHSVTKVYTGGKLKVISYQNWFFSVRGILREYKMRNGTNKRTSDIWV